tara:strand:- start:24 stop:125 length:102 start_codon:yes stop_codon:yes gene_type:complete
MNREAIDEAILKVKQMMGEVFYQWEIRKGESEE